MWTDEKIGGLPAPPKTRRAVHVAVGLSLTLLPDGRRCFTVHAELKDVNGWTKRIRRHLGWWPDVSLDEARTQAVYYRQMAARGGDFRRSKAELAQITKEYMATRHAQYREEQDAKARRRAERLEAQALRRRAVAEARELRIAANVARRAAQEAKKKKPLPPTHKTPKPNPTLDAAVVRQQLTNLWGK